MSLLPSPHCAPAQRVFSLKATQLMGATGCCRDSEVGIVRQLGCLGRGVVVSFICQEALGSQLWGGKQ